VVDEVSDPPLKFLKAAERVKMVPNTTHRLGQGGIPNLKVAFVSTLNLLLHFFPAKTHMLVSFCPVKLDFLQYLCDTFAMRIASQRQVYAVLAFWVAIVNAMRFVSQVTSQVLVCKGLRFAKVVRDLNRFFMRFFYLFYYGDSTRGTRGKSQLHK